MDNKIKFTAYCLGDPIGRNVNVQTLEEFARVLQCAEFDNVYKVSVSIQENVAPGAGVTGKNTVMSYYIADEIPPFDITISFANEYGYDSRMALYGVRLLNEGQSMATNDIYI